MTVQPELATPRLILRPFRLDDAAAVEQLAGAWSIADTTLNIPHPYPAGAGTTWIASHAERWEAGTNAVFAMQEKSSDKVVGALSLHIMREESVAELGYWVAVSRWGRGYCTEAAAEMLKFAFGDLGLKRVIARHMTRNGASGRVMQKIGMQLETRIPNAVEKWGRPEDIALYGANVEAWQPIVNPPSRTSWNFERF